VSKRWMARHEIQKDELGSEGTLYFTIATLSTPPTIGEL